jgi:hypothetical protein
VKIQCRQDLAVNVFPVSPSLFLFRHFISFRGAILDHLLNRYSPIWAARSSFNPTVPVLDPAEAVPTNRVAPRVSSWMSPDLFSF